MEFEQHEGLVPFYVHFIGDINTQPYVMFIYSFFYIEKKKGFLFLGPYRGFGAWGERKRIRRERARCGEGWRE